MTQELFILHSGAVQVWKDPDSFDPGQHRHEEVQLVTTLRPGQITGELSMLDLGQRSADLIAGKRGPLFWPWIGNGC
jgi:CRP-like cAMP-binding protein